MSRSDLVLRDGRVLARDWFQLAFARGGGPGGQHVNKTETKVDLRLDLEAAAAALGSEDVARIRAALQSRLDAEGRLRVVSSEHRSQHQNYAAALLRMKALLEGALQRRRSRRPTAPTRSSRQRRLQHKKRRGAIKRLRGGRGDGGE